MTLAVSRRTLLAASGALAMPWVRRAAAADPVLLRCSLDTAPSHLRNVSIADFLSKLEAASGGRIKTELYSSGQLFADKDVAKALLQGQAEMAAPGYWVLAGFVPDCEMFQLPAMYGQPTEVAHRVVDGKPGQLLGAELETKLRTHILGKWLELGFQNWYSSKVPLDSLASLSGLKLRNPGGNGLSWRTRFFGGIPNTTAWPDVALALSQGTFDGLISTNESIASSKLWDAGVRYSLQDHQFVGEYIPMLSNTFWTKLPPDLQGMMTDIWAAHIDEYRANMAQAQVAALKALEEHGVKVVTPSPEEIGAVRKKMLVDQDQMARESHINPDLVKLVMQEVGPSA